MNKITHFSEHAMERIKLRCKLHIAEIASILDTGKFVDTGCEPGFNRHHLLFYSRKDDQCFVLIQDRFIGKVITLLPLDYHHLAWRVSDAQCDEAKKLVMKRRLMLQQQHKGKIWLNALYLDENQKQRIHSLGTQAHELYNVESLTLKTDSGVLKRLCELICQSGLDPKSVYGLSARQSKKGVSNFVEIQLAN